MIRIFKNIIPGILFLLLSLSLLVSCSTKKNSFTRRVYHNLTGHYNTFWNGRESYREGVAQLEKTKKENYNKILPVYYYGTEQNAQSLNPYMDKAIDKASINVQNHSMVFSRREYVRWIDDSYLLIGLSYFYKQEYNKATRTFDYVMSEYRENPIRYQAGLWLAKSYIELTKYKRAQSILDNLDNDIKKNDDVPFAIIQALPLVRADLMIKQKKYPQATEPLRDALFLNQKKNMDARVRFILGQIFQHQGEYYKASDYYKQVIKKNPPYEMAFNAAINLATSYDTIYGESSKPIVKNLKKMLKEDKNIEFRDQIYFALADVSFKDRADSIGIDYLALSVASSVSNNYQKATSALKLGDIYFYRPNYSLAQAYYDTAVQVLPDDYPNSEEIKLRTTYLTELVDNLIIIETEDSLQKVAAMPEAERLALIDKIIEKVKEEEEKEKEQEELAQLNALNQTPSTSMAGGPTTSGSSWYFYNTQAKSFGFSEFKKKWGNRKLEDNWRLSNKQVLFQPDEEVVVAEGDSLVADSTGKVIVSNDKHEPGYYLQDLPFDSTSLATSNLKIEEAYFALGYIYKDKLLNLASSVESFEKLTTRYPETKHLLESWYQLYRVNLTLKNQERAEYYKKLIVEQFPDTDYARLITDPEYFKELEAKRNRAVTLYNETWQQYESGQYYTVYSNSSRALSEFDKPKELMAKFEYLQALSLGKIDVTDSMLVALDSLLIKYPNSEIAPMAQNLLSFWRGPLDSTGLQTTPEKVIDISIYNFNKNSKQIFALIVKQEGNININALKVRISDFNMKYYSLENLSITNILLDKTTHFIMVGNFDNIESSMKYYNAILASDYVFANVDKQSYDGFVITQENYPVLYKDKDLEKYLAFFRQKYLKQ